MASSTTRFAALAVCALLLTSCKPKVGSSCDKGESACLDGKQQLSCENGSYIATACRGPKGCTSSQSGVVCDISGNRAGDRCSSSDEGAASCTADGTAKVVCRKGRYQHEPCRGQAGCKSSGAGVACDTSLAQVGDTCFPDKAESCTVKGDALLRCQKGKTVVDLRCRGPLGCQFNEGKLNCDLSVAAPGDVCRDGMAGKHACGLDRHSILICKAGTFQADTTCKAGESCTFSDGGVRCAKTVK